MPGAKNLPWTELLDESGRLLSEDELVRRFETAGLDLSLPVTTSCGSGVTACLAALALYKLGIPARVYDGSWSEWGRREDLPVITA
jgi:thiosulfate/3-mercaptopyruvate sulfurtransferase